MNKTNQCKKYSNGNEQTKAKNTVMEMNKQRQKIL